MGPALQQHTCLDEMQALLRSSAFCHPVHTWSSLSQWPCFSSCHPSNRPCVGGITHPHLNLTCINSPTTFCHFYFYYFCKLATIAFPLYIYALVITLRGARTPRRKTRDGTTCTRLRDIDFSCGIPIFGTTARCLLGAA